MSWSFRRCGRTSIKWSLVFVLALFFSAIFQVNAQAFTLNVVGAGGGAVGPYRWLLQDDTTFDITAGDTSVDNTLAVNFHSSYAPVVAKGTQADTPPDPPAGKRYFISVLPDEGYTMSGAPVVGDSVTVTVHAHPIPTARISVFVFEDNKPINNAPDLPEERGLAGFKIVLEDAGGRYGITAGTQMMDAFGNPLGTVYDADGGVVKMGDGVVTTDADGRALIDNLAPGKYGVTVVPRAGEEWIQTSTIEGKKVIDAWVKPNEPPFFVEFGPPGYHVFVGFIQPIATGDSGFFTGSSTISGEVVNLHSSRPPDFTFWPGHPFPDCWVGLNNGTAGTGEGVYAQPCDANSEFAISGVPDGTWDLVIWDGNLNVIFATKQVIVDGASQDLGQIPVFAWFGRVESLVFNDLNGDGFRDPDEPGIPEQTVNLRFRDGSVYQSFPTDLEGGAPFDEVFPFFHWLVAEVDFARFKATGATFIVDAGGPVVPGEVLNPQPQPDPDNPGEFLPYRTETGEVLTQAFQLFLGQTNVMEFGKQEYGEGENGGISGVIFYATTRAEDDPALAAAEPWEPGIPRVQVNLYEDNLNNVTLAPGPDGQIDDINLPVGIQLADVDNYPFGWQEGTASKGPEDIDRDDPFGLVTDPAFDFGDAFDVTSTDSWDDNQPTGCQGEVFSVNGTPTDCFDGLRNFNQVRPGVFDGGYAFGDLAAGTYIVEAVPPPGYEILKEEDKNVDFGDTFIGVPAEEAPGGSDPVPQQAPLDNMATCVGIDHIVPDYLTLFPGKEVPAPYATLSRPLCDLKQVTLVDGLNAAADFFLFTEVPVAGQIVGVIVDDTANEFDPNAPSFGEKYSPPFLPISIRDWEGKAIAYTVSDRWGAYNALVPSTYTANLPQPSGMSPNMITVVLNDPTHPTVTANPKYSQFAYTFNYMPGTTTYLDTPVVPIAAFAGPGQFPVDVEFPDGTPVIKQVVDGPYVSGPGQSTITIESMGTVQVPNPAYDGTINTRTIPRDYGFGASGTVSIGGVPLNVISGGWFSTSITATVPSGTTTGQLVVTRADNNKSSVLGVTVTVGPLGTGPTGLPRAVHTVSESGSIQAAIDGANPGDLILVGPGSYDELVVMTKPVQLQGWGAGVTSINAVQAADKILDWRNTVESKWLSGEFDLLPAQTQEINFAGLEPALTSVEGAGISVFAKNTTPANGGFGSSLRARIDGFTVQGASTGGGIFVNGYAHYLQISNNRIRQNSGFAGGGIHIGHPDLVLETAAGLEYQRSENDHIRIHNNQVTGNGGLGGAGGGVSLYTGADYYEVRDNFIAGNFTLGHGAGIGHLGRSESGTIARNQIIFNQSFNQGTQVSGGGVFVGGPAPLVAGGITPGSGKVTVDGNLIQGNQAGAGDGGGIRTQFNLPGPEDEIKIINNFIVNNVAGLAGGGISMQNTEEIFINHNTIAHNDSTATAGAAFVDPNQSTAQPAGIISRASNPVMDSNIIWKNRSFYFRVDPTNPTSFGLLPDIGAGDTPVFWDLAGTLNPTNSVLTDPTGYDLSNVTGDPAFVAPYFNENRDQTIQQVETIGVQPAFDEGGNFIDVRFGPLTVGDSDYHIQAGSPAADGSVGNSELTVTDLDGDLAGTIVYAGADRPVATTTLAPVAANDSYTIELPNNSNNPAARTLAVLAPGVLGNDFDADGDPISASLLDDVNDGDLTMNSDGSFTYIAPQGFEGTVTFSYLASASSRGSVATVTIAVASKPANEAPNPTVADIITQINTVGITRVLPNDPNVGDTHEFTLQNSPSNGTATVSLTSGTVTYTPDLNFLGTDSLRVRVRDQDNKTGTVEVNITVSLNLSPTQDIQVQIPYDGDGIDTDGDGIDNNDNVYILLGAGDGFATMADDYEQYIFSFHDLSHLLPAVDSGSPAVRIVPFDQIMGQGMLAAEFPAPTIKVKEGQKLYLNMVNVGMTVRPDLFDPHTVHWHGFPQASSVFDGVPDASISVNMMASLTYYYNVVRPGTYMYHCHVEATEHMQMGMLGSLYVTPIQDGNSFTYLGKTYTQFAYNDGDGSTGYDRDYPIQMGSFDPAFHDASLNVQPLPFANMVDKYAMLNGRGYPDTVKTGSLAPPMENTYVKAAAVTSPPAPKKDSFHVSGTELSGANDDYNGLDLVFTSGALTGESRKIQDYTVSQQGNQGIRTEIVLAADLPSAPAAGDTFAIGRASQNVSSRIEAVQGERVLLRISNLNVTRFYTLASTIPMQVVGEDARLLRGPDGKDLYYTTNSVNLGGGQAVDAIIDTTGVAPGTYLLYTTNLNYLTNDQEDFGGMMTEITVTAAP